MVVVGCGGGCGDDGGCGGTCGTIDDETIITITVASFVVRSCSRRWEYYWILLFVVATTHLPTQD